MKATVEICVEGIRSAIAAGEGGADRIELCENLAIGGVTPSSGTIWAAKRTTLPIQVLIRPRGGDFRYHDSEFEVMQRDVEAARMLGASGVVLGLLDSRRRVDRRRTELLLKVARPMKVTFHKAFDATVEPLQALDDLIELGVDRILTSGQAPTAREGLPLLAELNRAAKGRISVMAGGSIGLGDIRPLLLSGISEIHVGSAACRDGSTDLGLVRKIVEAASISEIFHITSRTDWERAVSEGVYRADSLASDGFIHGSTSEQLAGSANRFFQGRFDLVVLRIVPGRLRSPIQWVASADSDYPFPHIHGPVDLDAVTDVFPMETDLQGTFRWPIQPGGESGTSW
ncbi:copper homeostasis protein CutC [Tundrisphaera lichenicola]|uniref:copper homeostasis protein CutC n=1 Tax=Tundrisphaera lichenicola TaxID=2029860 RepID=UPI003EC0AA14